MHGTAVTKYLSLLELLFYFVVRKKKAFITVPRNLYHVTSKMPVAAVLLIVNFWQHFIHLWSFSRPNFPCLAPLSHRVTPRKSKANENFRVATSFFLNIFYVFHKFTRSRHVAVLQCRKLHTNGLQYPTVAWSSHQVSWKMTTFFNSLSCDDEDLSMFV